jgi:hypothetical protein
VGEERFGPKLVSNFFFNLEFTSRDGLAKIEVERDVSISARHERTRSWREVSAPVGRGGRRELRKMAK